MTLVIRSSSLCLIVMLVVLTPSSAPAQEDATAQSLELSWLGPSREISHGGSASRDTAALGLMIVPRPVLSGGGDFALVGLRAPWATFRLGFFGMLELESEKKTQDLLPFPVGDIHFWRGIWGFSLASSSESLSKVVCGAGCALEATLSMRHESEHYTGSNDGGAGIDYSDRPHVGNFIMLDLAGRWQFGDWSLLARLQHKFFLPDASGYTHGPGGDFMVRYRLLPGLDLFDSLFGEYLLGVGGFPDAYLVRNLVGAVLPSHYGDLYIYLSADVGHRKGLAVYTEEATLGFGIRVVLAP